MHIKSSHTNSTFEIWMEFTYISLEICPPQHRDTYQTIAKSNLFAIEIQLLLLAFLFFVYGL